MSNNKMKAVVFEEIDKSIVTKIDIPSIKDNEVLVRNKYVGLCGTDMHILHGDFPATYPIVPGHEFVGTIEEIGREVKGFNIGDNVVIDPSSSCGNCYYCKNNYQNFCTEYDAYGVTLNGGFAEYTKVYFENIYKINDIDLREAVLLEPLACVIYGLSKLKINYGDKAIIFGVGPIGLLLLQVLNLSGVSNVYMADIDKEKIEIGKKFGAKDVFLNDKELNGKIKSVAEKGFNILVDATGRTEVCQELFNYTAVKSSVLFFGVCDKNKKINISPFQIYRQDISIYGTFSSNHNISNAIELLRSGKLNLTDIISHEMKLEDFSKVFNIIKSGNHLKVIFNCQ